MQCIEILKELAGMLGPIERVVYIRGNARRRLLGLFPIHGHYPKLAILSFLFADHPTPITGLSAAYSNLRSAS